MDVPHEFCPLFILDGKNSSGAPTALNIFVVFLNCISLLMTLISNTLVVFVICYKPSLRASSNILVASQASANVVISILAQPSLIVLEIEEILGNANGYCMSQLITIVVSIICILLSFFSVLGMVADQYLALQHSVWHASNITPRNAASMVFLAWLVTALTCSLFATFGEVELFVFVTICLAVLVMFSTLLLNVKNYLRIRQYFMQVQQQLETPSNMPTRGINTPNIACHQKAATMVFFILASNFITHVPFFSTFVMAYKVGWSTSLQVALTLALTIVYVSSVIYTLICSRWNDGIRRAVFHILGL